jgi:hypothetical protein
MWICDIRVFFLSEFFLPSLFFLRVCGFEGGALAAVEVERCALEQGNVLCYEDVFDG